MITDDLEQYDFVDDEYFEEAVELYSALVGSFMMNFSYLDHELNIAIANIINDRAHDVGYAIVERIMMRNKIELFYKLYSRLESATDNKTKSVLDKIRKDFEDMNEYRNQIAHANWQTINKEGEVRVKIVVDSKEGYIKFKKVKITPKDIKLKVEQIDELYDRLTDYTEKVMQF